MEPGITVAAIGWPVAVLMLWITAAAMAGADRCRTPELALGLLNLGDASLRTARAMLAPRKG